MQIFHSVFSLFMYQVMDAEKQKAESGTLHQEKTLKFHAAESKVRTFKFIMFDTYLVY